MSPPAPRGRGAPNVRQGNYRLSWIAGIKPYSVAPRFGRPGAACLDVSLQPFRVGRAYWEVVISIGRSAQGMANLHAYPVAMARGRTELAGRRVAFPVRNEWLPAVHAPRSGPRRERPVHDPRPPANVLDLRRSFGC